MRDLSSNTAFTIRGPDARALTEKRNGSEARDRQKILKTGHTMPISVSYARSQGTRRWFPVADDRRATAPVGDPVRPLSDLDRSVPGAIGHAPCARVLVGCAGCTCRCHGSSDPVDGPLR